MATAMPARPSTLNFIGASTLSLALSVFKRTRQRASHSLLNAATSEWYAGLPARGARWRRGMIGPSASSAQFPRLKTLSTKQEATSFFVSWHAKLGDRVRVERNRDLSSGDLQATAGRGLMEDLRVSVFAGLVLAALLAVSVLSGSAYGAAETPDL